jgi:hypothetical protein
MGNKMIEILIYIGLFAAGVFLGYAKMAKHNRMLEDECRALREQLND